METLSLKALKGLIRAACGLERSDIVLKNARLVNVFSGKVKRCSLSIYGDRIAALEDVPAKRVIDLEGMYIAPGFIDGHIHIESTMLTPRGFAEAVLPRGTTAVIADPHEIANVKGTSGIRYMLNSSKGLPLDIFFMLPSSVPSTGLETSGARLGAKELLPFLKHRRVTGLAEVMDYLGVLEGKRDILAKLKTFSTRPVDGHAPGLRGGRLSAYISAGIYSDHESTTPAEAEEKLEKGMYVMIREGTVEKDLDALLPLVGHENSRRFIFVSDDIHPLDLEKGHMDRILAKAVSGGLDPVTALRLATLNPAEYFGLSGYGAAAPGYFADLVVLEDLKGFNVCMTFKRGRIVAKKGRVVSGVLPEEGSIKARSMNIGWRRMGEIKVRAAGRVIKVIEVLPGGIRTKCITVRAEVRDGLIVPDSSRDILKAVVVERHRGRGTMGVAFVKGFGLKRGAIASTVAHDAHNIISVGVDDSDILFAVKVLERMGGGLVAVDGTRVVASLKLPVAGLMTERPLKSVVRDMRALLKAARRLGSDLKDPYMTMSFLALPVVPELRITDRGLVDARAGRFTSLFVTR